MRAGGLLLCPLTRSGKKPILSHFIPCYPPPDQPVWDMCGTEISAWPYPRRRSRAEILAFASSSVPWMKRV
jgi:hypothetical protein